MIKLRRNLCYVQGQNTPLKRQFLVSSFTDKRVFVSWLIGNRPVYRIFQKTDFMQRFESGEFTEVDLVLPRIVHPNFKSKVS